MLYPFSALLARMKYITRWSLMHSTRPESLSEHTCDTALLAHLLCLIAKHYTGTPCRPEAVAVAALYHDAPEIITGDMPTPVKYHSPALRDAYKALETESVRSMAALLPAELAAELTPCMDGSALTARSEERDELQGFDLGVDEYISKPFSPKILVARVEAILRRTQGSGNTDEISAGGIVVDKAAHTVMSDGSPVDLSFKEFELLTYFIENQGIALSREKILNNVWNYDYFGDARTIDTHVKKLRSKLGDKGEYIKTIWGMGYKFEVE